MDFKRFVFNLNSPVTFFFKVTQTYFLSNLSKEYFVTFSKMAEESLSRLFKSNFLLQNRKKKLN